MWALLLYQEKLGKGIFPSEVNSQEAIAVIPVCFLPNCFQAVPAHFANRRSPAGCFMLLTSPTAIKALPPLMSQQRTAASQQSHSCLPRSGHGWPHQSFGDAQNLGMSTKSWEGLLEHNRRSKSIGEHPKEGQEDGEVSGVLLSWVDGDERSLKSGPGKCGLLQRVWVWGPAWSCRPQGVGAGRNRGRETERERAGAGEDAKMPREPPVPRAHLIRVFRAGAE